MGKLTKLKVELIKYNRSKDLTTATDICKWLYKELIKPAKKIEVKEG